MTSSVNVSSVLTSNTFENWRVQTNLLVTDTNEIARGDFTKPAGNITVSVGRIALSNATGTSLDITADARVSGRLSVKNIEQDGGAAYFYSDSTDIKFRADGTFHANGNTRTRYLYNNNFISAANVNATGFIETLGTYANANAIMNVGGVLLIRSTANGGNSYFSSNLSVTGNLTVSGRMNAATANIGTLAVTTLTVTDPITAPSESDSNSYRLRVSQVTRGDGSFGVNQGGANGNALLTFAETSDVWRVTSNSIAGVYSTLLSVANLSDSISTTSSVNAASLTAVRTAYDAAVAAYAKANSAANTVRVSQNTGSTIVAANGINFNNTSTILITVGAGINGNANVAFSVDNTNPTLIGPQGIQGIQGTSGSAGSQGATGAQGTAGSAGAQGTTGTSGSNGSQGATGAQGTTGAQGATGTQGTTGTSGAQGTSGASGAQGTTGSTGIQGATGTAGAQGTTGATGPSTAINASNDTSTTTLYPVCVAAAGSNQVPKVRTTATAFTFNASTGVVSAVDFSAASDIRLKTVVGPIDYAMDMVRVLSGVRYLWNDTAREMGQVSDAPQVGVIAQEVQNVLPEAVHTVNGYLSVSYDKIVPVLIEAIKELNKRIEILEGK